MRRLVLIACCCVALSQATVAMAISSPSPDYLIKAQYLYRFAMFVSWPSEAFMAADAPIVICLAGSDPFGEVLDRTVQDNRINKRSITVRRLQGGQDPKQCQILFISALENARVADTVNRLEGHPTLIVGETPDFAQRGGMINFIIKDNKVGLEVNVDAAKRARLTISSRVLDIARIVRG